jgi:hypothetical protein
VAFLRSDEASFINGAILPVDGGRSALGQDPEEVLCRPARAGSRLGDGQGRHLYQRPADPRHRCLLPAMRAIYKEDHPGASSAILRKPEAVAGEGLVMVRRIWVVVTGSKRNVVGWPDAVAQVMVRLGTGTRAWPSQ